MKYKLKIDTDALQDIKTASDWYDEQQKNLGKRYKAQVVKQINELRENPLLISVRYKNVHCLKIKKFPFLVHFTIDGEYVNVFAVIHTSRHPKIWEQRSR